VTVLGSLRLPGTQFDVPGNVSLHTVTACVSAATAYAVSYATFALSAGMWLFQGRELGGGEG
jgi:hypothetical protein